MVTFLFTSVLVLGLLAIAIYFWQKPANPSQTTELPWPTEEPRGLFSDVRVNQLNPPTAKQLSEDTPKVDAETFQEAIEAIKAFQESPNRTTTTKLLHVAALTDNAKTYERAIQLVLLSWRDGSLSDLSARELQALVNGEYWVLSTHTRTSGAGFVLKEMLSSAKRELEEAANKVI
jgi:hypothetical protein